MLDAEFWAKRACDGENAEIFYPKYGGGAPEQRRKAKAICFGCQVREACLEDALDRQEPHGIWGGMDPAERRRLRPKPRSTRRGRPPKPKPAEAA